MRDKKLHPKLTLIILLIITVLTTATALAWMGQRKNDTVQTAQNPPPAQVVETESPYVSYDGVEGKTALELLKAEAEVVTKQSDFGEYVDTVNGVVGGTDGQYWAFYVNGQMAQIGAGAYQTKNGDKIEWKFE